MQRQTKGIRRLRRLRRFSGKHCRINLCNLRNLRIHSRVLERKMGGEMKREVVRTDRAPKAIGPYEQALKVDGWVFTSGQIALDPKTGAMVEGGIGAQTRQGLENLRGGLEAAGTSMSRVVKATVYMTNLGDFQKM